MPSLKGNIQEESISSLARRVLGIKIKYWKGVKGVK
jgi:hypothetical protein